MRQPYLTVPKTFESHIDKLVAQGAAAVESNYDLGLLFGQPLQNHMHMVDLTAASLSRITSKSQLQGTTINLE